MERGVETGDLRQARECFGERACAAYVEGLVRRLHLRQGVEVVEHVAVDAHRRLEAGAAEHHAVAGRDHLRIGEIGFQPGDDEVQRGPVVDRVARAPFMRGQRLAGRVFDDEMRIALHAVDPADGKAGATTRPRPPHRRRISGWWIPR